MRDCLLAAPSSYGNLALTGEEAAALQRLQAWEDRYCLGTVEGKALIFSRPVPLQQQPTWHPLATHSQEAQQEEKAEGAGLGQLGEG